MRISDWSSDVCSSDLARITAGNAEAMLVGHDVIVDGCDNFATRLAVADAALALHIPLVSAAVGQFEGQIATFRGWEADKPCYRRSEEHTSELQSLMRISYAVFCLKKKKDQKKDNYQTLSR